MSKKLFTEISSNVYTDEKFYQQEKTNIFNNHWIFVAHESQFTKLNTFQLYTIFKFNLVILRISTNQYKAYNNSCSHRGNVLIKKSCGSLNSIKCQYHGWDYSLDGELKSAPFVDSSFNLKKCKLKELPLINWNGLLFVNLNGANLETEGLSNLQNFLDPFVMTDFKVNYNNRTKVNCNWKVFLDSLIEAYHIPTVHKMSINNLLKDFSSFEKMPIGDHFYLKIRFTDKLKTKLVDRLCVDKKIDLNTEVMRSYHKFLLFPNTVVNVTPFFVTIYNVVPIDINQSEIRFSFLGRKQENFLCKLRNFATYLITRKIFSEDLKIMEPYQCNLENPLNNKSFKIHSYEEAIHHYIRKIIEKI